MLDNRILSHNIKKYQEHRGMSQSELAERLFVSSQAISKWERGLSVPEIDKICILAELYGVSVDTLLGVSVEREMLMVGVDGGGTKTEYIVFNQNGKIYERLVAEGSNPNFYGRDKVCDSLKRNLSHLIDLRPWIKGVYIGSAGFRSGDNGEYVRASLKSFFPSLKIKCGGDVFNAMASGTDEKKCICSISGTGNITFCYNEGEFTRYGGYGYLFDKAGSGYDIGREAIYTALNEGDGINMKSATEMRNPKTTHIDKMETIDIVRIINEENMNAVKAVDACICDISKAIDLISERYKSGGRIFYMGAGTSGRLGVIDAAECPPTYGVSPDSVIGIIAGGEKCLSRAGENFEDSDAAGVGDLEKYHITEKDTVIGLSVAGNLMINLRPTNKKLTYRMITIVCDILEVDEQEAEKLLEENDWNIRAAIESVKHTDIKF